MTNDITLTTTVQRNEKMIDASIDGETVMMSIEHGLYYGLDSVASKIWQLIEKPKSVANICYHLQQSYDINEQQCQQEVIGFLKKLNQNDIIALNT